MEIFFYKFIEASFRGSYKTLLIFVFEKNNNDLSLKSQQRGGYSEAWLMGITAFAFNIASFRGSQKNILIFVRFKF